MGRLLFGVATIAISATMFGGQLAEMLAGKPERAATAEIGPARAQAKPQAPVALGPRIVSLRGDTRGHFSADIQVNGAFVRALVDTGASMIALSAEDARRSGIDPARADFRHPVQTANGVVHAAKVRIGEVRLQSLVVRDVEAAVLPPGALKGTLLGMSFLKRLASFEMTGGTLVLKQ